jgi:hypothetical protein
LKHKSKEFIEPPAISGGFVDATPAFADQLEGLARARWLAARCRGVIHVVEDACRKEQRAVRGAGESMRCATWAPGGR